ncbi:MAG: CBS domain-containing protein [Bacteroidota bacterium]|nr:CBS domain-containing protein [Candidatus Kapabacteria bacterium]MCS7301902.1 CBS domain-containing protein [Candidatus Kapabacteria bacterium]MCX7936155.1 CBS domain-containing protein [Chlorobiota bacterium]MDW8074951.1 CBS domain-containing protein [Bacteroidota bacterium]MDW8271590.1 CBS domain-containing protein [Bacteroidota bacterium]
MSEDGSHQLLVTLIAWGSGILLSVISFVRSVIASASATRIEHLHERFPELLDCIYDARRLGSVERTLLMVLDVATVAAVSASLAALYAPTGGMLMIGGLLGIVAGVVLWKALVHVLGAFVADGAILVVARWFRGILRVSVPFVLAIEAVDKLLHARHRSQEEAREQVAEELTAIMEEAVEEGTLEAGQVRILQNIMRVRDIHVEDVMTPRSVMAGLPADMTIADAAKMPELQTYSRLPVWEGMNVDAIIGYVLSRDILLRALSGGGDEKVRSLVRQVVFIPENIGLDRALEEFLTRRQHMFIVVDEYGSVEGLITLEDVVETILGTEIVDEADRIVDLRQLAQQQRDRRIAQQTLHHIVAQSERQ